MEFDLTKPYNYYFNEICRIPHGSRNEKALSDYIVSFARERNLKVKQDKAYNVMIDKPASPGAENAPALIIQAHIDMVCAAEPGVKHDFAHDPLDLYVDDEGCLRARGTTLGADDGKGAAYMLAILADDTLKHPRLECIFTTGEEIGLVGASQLTPEDIHADQLICLDGGGETATNLSSAGGCDVSVDLTLNMVPNSEPAYTLTATGLAGGHSGGQIHMELGNADTLAVRILEELRNRDIPVHLVSLSGGLKDNAIPDTCTITFTSPAEPKTIQDSVSLSAAAIRNELKESDPGFKASLSPAEADRHADDTSSNDLLDFIFLMPNGFQHRSLAIPGLTLTSLNLGILTTDGAKVHMQTLVRSAIDSAVDDLMHKLQILCDRFDYAFSTQNRYPGWNYKPVSRLRDIYAEVLRERGQELKLIAVHGGTECGVFAGLNPNLDIITFGAVSKDAHTPRESLDLASYDRSYDILCEILAKAAA